MLPHASWLPFQALFYLWPKISRPYLDTEYPSFLVFFVSAMLH